MNESPDQQRDDAPTTVLDRLLEAAVKDARREGIAGSARNNPMT